MIRSRSKNFSFASDDNPFDEADIYYGDATNPSNLNSKFGKTRTFSVTETASFAKYHMNPYRSDNLTHPESIQEATNSSGSSKEELPLSIADCKLESASLSSSSAAVGAAGINHPPTVNGRRPSIYPIYHDEPTMEPIPEPESSDHKFRYHARRSSLDQTSQKSRKFYISDIDATLRELLENEDTDHNYQITIEDTGPKVLSLGTVNSNGLKKAPVYGTYRLSNLLQELTIAKRFGRKAMILDEQRLSENPVKRLQRLIQTQFWKSLTRQITIDNVFEMSKDTKITENYIDDQGIKHENKETHRIYIPYDCEEQFNYFKKVQKIHPNFDVVYLPKNIDANFILSINHKPGLLSLAYKKDPKNSENLIHQPYVVPGGRFNELYGWDSYMETLGLLTDVTRGKQTNLKLARGMTENFIYEIYHYGKILNANRSYYLGRSQPPFLTDMALRVFNKTMEVAPELAEDSLDFLKRATIAAIKEYHTVWCCAPRLDEATGLSCYHPSGKGVPPETEATHFDAILKPYLEKYNLEQSEFIKKYNHDEISESKLDEYFLHDRAVRESGHDTSYRLEGRCAYLATVDLNSLLYKYETDIAFIISAYFEGQISYNDKIQTEEDWLNRSKIRKENINKYLWNEEDSIYYDYNVKEKAQNPYESATTFWPLYANVASKNQAEAIVKNTLKKLEEFGGLAAGTLRSRGEINISRPSRQWDYPYGWAPQQILAWIGLINYEFDGVARRLAYRWLYMMTKAFVDYNGVVVEKYNVTGQQAPHKVDAEYGNQGLDFKGVATEGFGWVNASYLFGLQLMNVQAVRALGALSPPPDFLDNLHPEQKKFFE